MCRLAPARSNTGLPNASTLGWQVAQSRRVSVGACVLGGMPWHDPQNTVPLSFHTGALAPWQAFVQLAVELDQPALAITSAGNALSRCPAAPTLIGT